MISSYDHTYLNRTHSEDSPKSPLDIATTASTVSSRMGFAYGMQTTTAEIHSRTSSRQSQLETSRSDTMSTDNFFIDSYHSQDSGSQANTFRSVDMSNNSSSQDTNLMYSRRGSHTLQTEPIFIGRNELEQLKGRSSAMGQYENNGQQPYESHSLPRRTCIHHKQEDYNSYSLPRRDHSHHHHYVHEHEHSDHRLSNGNIPEQIAIIDPTRRVPMYTSQDAISRRQSHVVIAPDTYSLSRRSSAHQQQSSGMPQQTMPHQHLQLRQQQSAPIQQIQQYRVRQPQQQSTAVQQVPSEELCSTCESETDSKENEGSDHGDEEEEIEEEETETDEETDDDEEKEIFIDFKPRISPTPSPSITKKKKKLVKTLSEGEILVDKKKHHHGTSSAISASEEDLQPSKEIYTDKHLHYADTPIRDEDIFNVENFLNVSPDSSTTVSRYSRESFRKRSVSLEDPLADDEIPKPVSKTSKTARSAPDSPCPDELSVQQNSFPSTDSLVNDITRDHSDGIWNESQATVLQANSRWVVD